MVDVLINHLLKNKEIVDELTSNNPEGSDRVPDMPDGEEAWRTIYDHPLTAATSAMLNIGGSASEDQNSPMNLLCEYYKLPLDKIADKYGTLPDFWTTVANGQTNIVGNNPNALGNSLPVTLLPQAAELLKNKRTSDPNDVTPQEVDIYLNRRIIKRENINDGDELIVPTSGVINTHKSVNLLRNCNSPKVMNDGVLSDPPVSPLPMLVQVKQEPSPGLPTSPSSPSTKNRELPPASTVIAQAYSSHVLAQNYESLAAQYSVTAPLQYQSQPSTGVYMVTTPPEYRGLPDYYTEQIRNNLAATVGTSVSGYTDTTDTVSFVDRYIRQAAGYKNGIQGLTVDLPSPDSGIGDTTIATRDNSSIPHVEIFDYSDLSQTQTILQSDIAPSRPASSQSGSSRRSWHDYGRNAELDKVQIPKLHSDVGFKYFLESPISTSQRREDDRITYINKGQFYGITLEFTPDPTRPLKSSTVKSVVMLMFREEKPPDEELKAWQFWHSRQHSVKQRILDADTKNSTGIIGQIDEVTHNAIAFYWNPLESSCKVNVAVQCLSTDFSNQKGVKGLPLHLQIDTFDDFRENVTPYHRGYCQIKVFCDKGAERKTRDEERRAAKRKLSNAAGGEASVTFPGRKKLDEMFHLPCDRSEFYSMSDLLKPPVLFTPSDDVEKMTSMDLAFYTSPSSITDDQNGSGLDRRDTDSRESSSTFTPPPKRMKKFPGDRDSYFSLPVLLYARQESEDTFQPLHIHPPTLAGLAKGIESKYKLSASNIRNIYKKSKKGITVQIDDDIVKHYCNEDVCIIEVTKVDEELCDVTLVDA
ncbi:grainyhead-like protein 1 homolog isoform X2 [Argiope bruennichi]|uniref:Protein grainyhead like protein n=1 Tax=Argiope bruennichi TaxID=94029 RepID=A0A8T0F6T2_ARGBR|nr:grainyhead-like protein 1 homolog isoform X2 [Argiope bruennichi]KAF8785140.1 Protein grainyhead like protein [Argiope bruennichi]